MGTPDGSPEPGASRSLRDADKGKAEGRWPVRVLAAAFFVTLLVVGFTAVEPRLGGRGAQVSPAASNKGKAGAVNPRPSAQPSVGTGEPGASQATGQGQAAAGKTPQVAPEPGKQAVTRPGPQPTSGQAAPAGAKTSPGRPVVRSYVVQAGDNLTVLARRWGLKTDTLVWANHLADADAIFPGQKLQVPAEDGVLYRVQPGDSLWAICRRYGVVRQRVVAANGLNDPDHVPIGTLLLLPGAKPLGPPPSQRGGVASRGGRYLLWPVASRNVTSGFGWRWGRSHEGVDIAIGSGSPVRAAAAGRVEEAGAYGAYGLWVRIRHPGGLETRYAHNSRLTVQAGQWVEAGQIIAYSGMSGNATGPHLHFEIWKDGQPANPRQFVR